MAMGITSHASKLVAALDIYHRATPNKGMELTVKSTTPSARGRTKRAPLLPAAHPRC